MNSGFCSFCGVFLLLSWGSWRLLSPASHGYEGGAVARTRGTTKKMKLQKNNCENKRVGGGVTPMLPIVYDDGFSCSRVLCDMSLD